MVNITACPRCNGEGRVVGTPCHTCRGDGRIREDRRLEVSIPAGIESGQRVALEGQGEAGPRSGPPGDLFVLVTVRDDPDLVRRGSELWTEVPVTFAQAALGGQVTVRTVEGTEPVDVPAGTQSGQEIRLRGRGMPRLRGSGRGDLHVIVTVVVPAKLSKREKELLHQLNEASAPATLPRSGPSLGDRLRDLFS
jgi:molecular chaperone DnaJ